MSRAALHTLQWFREEAERCFRLAEKLTDERASEDLITYGRELLARAEHMEMVRSAATAEGTVSEILLDESG